MQICKIGKSNRSIPRLRHAFVPKCCGFRRPSPPLHLHACCQPVNPLPRRIRTAEISTAFLRAWMNSLLKKLPPCAMHTLTWVNNYESYDLPRYQMPTRRPITVNDLNLTRHPIMHARRYLPPFPASKLNAI
ncbi:hypothetical protein HBI46_236340 [Parastagonospora nodorum]|nr:hypothetical protein HBI46_236340 [Parastagonospora nodorum]KAH5709287.1 hypothetical protein HBI20_188420 [Parastagonospora nodorum]KAH6029257.1 hypothetical protein HBI54_227300 [Parastagonospora nodorum]KAH6524005.1 hypothetical protein HBI07_207720 [Parastagonospora nodorum]